MDIARCDIDGNNYHAADFARLPPPQLAEYRHHLTCLGNACGAPAYFRSRSRSGQAPCFASRHHTTDCDASNLGLDPDGGATTSTAQEQINHGDVLHIDTDPRPARTPVHRDPAQPADADVISPRHRRRDDGGARLAHSTRRLRPLLRDLVRTDPDTVRNQVVDLPGWPTQPFHQFFRHISTLTREDAGHRGGYWGTIRRAKPRDDVLWIDAGTPGTPGILVPAAHLTAFLDHEGINPHTLDHLVGRHVLVLSQVRLAASGNLYVRLEKLTHYTTLQSPARTR